MRHLKVKAETIKTAVKESLERFLPKTKLIDFSSWEGFGKQAPVNKKPKFHSDDDLWE